MRKSMTAIITALVLTSAAFSSQATLTREQQLKAAKLRNPEVARLASHLIEITDTNCGYQTDKQVEDIQNSDFFFTMVAIQNVLPEPQFNALLNESYDYLTCTSSNQALSFIKYKLNIK